MNRRQIFSLLVEAFLIVFSAIALYLGYFKLSDFSTALPYAIIAGAVGVFLWGFLESIEKRVKAKPKLEPPTDSLRDKLELPSSRATLEVTPDFEAFIQPKKILRQGDTIYFNVKFNGELANGFLIAAIINSTGKLVITIPEPATLPNPSSSYSKGTLNGRVNIRKEWSWSIPLDFAVGEYEYFIAVSNHIPLDWKVRWRIRGIHFYSWLGKTAGIQMSPRTDLAVPNRPLIRSFRDTFTVNE